MRRAPADANSMSLRTTMMIVTQTTRRKTKKMRMEKRTMRRLSMQTEPDHHANAHAKGRKAPKSGPEMMPRYVAHFSGDASSQP